ncbi:MAG TPA: matrixin family metalloprotease, partial [Polyangiaceae bacterium]|nr:matrixin family metalloprotease [Polyangiaceae bacterium]
MLSALLWGDPARAYCPEVTKAPPPNYDPTVQGCFSNDPITGRPLPTLFWSNPCVGYSIQRSASSQVSLADATRVAAQAFSAWSSAACANGSPSITAVALAPVDCADVPSQEHNSVIIFRDNGWPYADSANTLGYTTLTVNTCTGEIYGADIEINSSDYQLSASGPVPAGGYDLASILTHEAGHFLGLAHSAEKSAVMFASYHAGSTALTLDDIGGICSIYSGDGTRNTSLGPVASTSVCDPSPRLGFLTEC